MPVAIRTAIVLALAAGACGGGSADSPPDLGADAAAFPDATVEAAAPARLSQIEATIFTRSCTFSTCHGDPSPKQELRLVAPTYAGLVQVAATGAPGRIRVVPGRPDESYLVEKLTRMTPAAGEQMPPSQPLPAAEIEMIRSWIAAGARDD